MGESDANPLWMRREDCIPCASGQGISTVVSIHHGPGERYCTPVNGWWGKYVGSWAHVPSMPLGLAQCVWEEYRLVEIAWKVSQSPFSNCHAITASRSPETQDMLMNRVPPAGQKESPGWGWMTGFKALSTSQPWNLELQHPHP